MEFKKMLKLFNFRRAKTYMDGFSDAAVDLIKSRNNSHAIKQRGNQLLSYCEHPYTADYAQGLLDAYEAMWYVLNVLRSKHDKLNRYLSMETLNGYLYCKQTHAIYDINRVLRTGSGYVILGNKRTGFNILLDIEKNVYIDISRMSDEQVGRIRINDDGDFRSDSAIDPIAIHNRSPLWLSNKLQLVFCTSVEAN